jgi:hypothetical protein
MYYNFLIVRKNKIPYRYIKCLSCKNNGEKIYTIKPVLRGHLRDKVKVALFY